MVRSSASRACAAVMLFGAAVLSSHARAQDPPTRPLHEAVTVAAADACFAGETLRAHLASWLGRDQLDARLEVVVEASESGAVSFVVRSGGEVVAVRRFDRLPSDCADRRAAVTLAIALAIDHTLLDRMASETAPSAALSDRREEPSTAGSPRDDARRPRRAPTEAAPALETAVGLGPVALFFVLPEVAAAGALAVELGHRSTVVRASAMLSTVAGADVGAGRGEVQLAAGRLDACLLHPIGALRLGGCAGVAVGAVLAEGRGYAVSQATSAPWVSAIGRLSGRLALGEATWLGLAVDGLFALVQPRLDVRAFDGTPVAAHDLPPAGLALALELVLGIR